MRVLIIEDDSATAQSMELMLKSEGHNVYMTNLGEEGIDLAKLYDYDIISLDLNLPDMSGFEVLRALRLAKVKTPVIVVTGLAGHEHVERALGQGADDYLTKPFYKDEWIARMTAIVRRSKGHDSPRIAIGPFTIDINERQVSTDNGVVEITAKEFSMLEILALRRGACVTKEMLMNHLYGGRDEPELKIVDVFICKLRAKLMAASGGVNPIETVWGRGYICREGHVPTRKERFSDRYAPDGIPDKRVVADAV